MTGRETPSYLLVVLVVKKHLIMTWFGEKVSGNEKKEKSVVVVALKKHLIIMWFGEMKCPVTKRGRRSGQL